MIRIGFFLVSAFLAMAGVSHAQLTVEYERHGDNYSFRARFASGHTHHRRYGRYGGYGGTGVIYNGGGYTYHYGYPGAVYGPHYYGTRYRYRYGNDRFFRHGVRGFMPSEVYASFGGMVGMTEDDALDAYRDGVAHLKSGHYVEARDRLRAALAYGDAGPAWKLAFGLALLGSENTSAGLKSIARAIEQWPEEMALPHLATDWLPDDAAAPLFDRAMEMVNVDKPSSEACLAAAWIAVLNGNNPMGLLGAYFGAGGTKQIADRVAAISPVSN